jgi:hypothetical protein
MHLRRKPGEASRAHTGQYRPHAARNRASSYFDHANSRSDFTVIRKKKARYCFRFAIEAKTVSR